MGLFSRKPPPRPRGGSPNRVSRDALTAAGYRIKRELAEQQQRLAQPWQSRAFFYYDELGCIKYASQFYARMLAPLRLYAAKLDENGDWVEIEPGADGEGTGPPSGDDARALAALERIKDPGGGGRENLQAAYGRLLFIAGEAQLFCSLDKDTQKEQWEMLSRDELKVNGTTYSRVKAPSLNPEEYKEPADDDYSEVDDETAVAYRLWRKHPRFSDWPDSPMRGVLDDCMAEGTMVSTTRGPQPIEEVEVGDEVFAWTAAGMDTHRVVRHCVRGEQLVYKVTAGRRTIRATDEHPVFVLRKSRPGKGYAADYELRWIDVGDLAVGDHLVAADHMPDYGTPQILPDGTPLTEKVAWLLGHVVADGHVHEEGVNISVHHDERHARIAAAMDAVWGLRDHPQAGTARFYSRALRRTLARMGLRVKSPARTIPAVILAAPAAIKRSFLVGYEEADGHRTKQGWQSLALTSERLARELRSLYIELGENVSNVAVEERAPAMVMPGGKVCLNAKPLYRFQVYYGSRRRGARGILQAAGAQERIGGEHFTLATIKAIEPDGIVPTYDLEVEGAHNYVADGVVTHNCEELLLLSRAVRSRTRSRLASAGLLAISEEFSHVPLEPVPDEDATEDPFLVDLTAAMMAAIEHEGAASASVPIVVRGPTEAVKNGIRHIQIVDPTQLYPETGLRYELIQRIAIGLDMPAEVLTGLGDVNHWGAWQIDEQTWKAHGIQVADQFVGDLNSAYYWPQLKDDQVVDPSRYAIRYDPAAVINHPDRTKDAKDLHASLVVSDEYLREAAGVDEDAAPDREELVRRIGMLVKDGSLAVTGVPRALDSPGGPSGQGDPTIDGTENVPAGPTGPATSGEVDKVPPPPPGDTEPITAAANGNRAEIATAIRTARLLGAVDLALARAREVAGNRILSKMDKHPELLALIEAEQGRARDVAAILGIDRVRDLGYGDARALVAPATALLVDSLRVWRIDDTTSGLVAEQVARHAARTLFDRNPSPLPPNFEGYLEGVFPAS